MVGIYDAFMSMFLGAIVGTILGSLTFTLSFENDIIKSITSVDDEFKTDWKKYPLVLLIMPVTVIYMIHTILTYNITILQRIRLISQYVHFCFTVTTVILLLVYNADKKKIPYYKFIPAVSAMLTSELAYNINMKLINNM